MFSFDVMSRWPIDDIASSSLLALLVVTEVSSSARDGPSTVVRLVPSVDACATAIIATITTVQDTAAISATTDGDDTE